MSPTTTNSDQVTSGAGQGPMGEGNYVVKESDCIDSIAYEKGFFADTLWNDSHNSDLRIAREEKNILLPGDKIYIPKKQVKEESCKTEQKHRFRRKGIPVKLNVILRLQGKPREQKECIIEIDGRLSEGKTDDEGRISVPIYPNARKGKITLKEGGEEFELKLGGLDPIAEIAGFQSRLANLGYELEISGQLDKATIEAVKLFQSDQNLEITGKMDEKTQKKLKDIYNF